MLLKIEQPGCDTCPLCRPMVGKQGFIVEDNTGRRVFPCSSHVRETLNAFLTTLRMVAAEA